MAAQRIVKAAPWWSGRLGYVRPETTQSEFIGYDHLRAEVKIVRLQARVKVRDKPYYHLVCQSDHRLVLTSVRTGGDTGYLDGW